MYIGYPHNNKAPNTIIGGIGGTINTKSLLATKLGISESIIRGFEVVGSDVHCRITSNYNIPSSTFLNENPPTFYDDIEGMVHEIGTGGLRNTGVEYVNFPNLTSLLATGLGYNTNLTEINLPITFMGGQAVISCPNATTISFPNIESILPSSNLSNQFAGLTSCTLLSMKKLKYFGNDPSSTFSSYRAGFDNLKIGCVIQVHEYMATNNGGNPQAVWTWVKANRGAIVEFYDDNGDYVSTL